ncbi:gliding motility-associated C-terminal domain-containing protein [Pontibacter sp. G13]|uniref:T9SS type B sorting domain-containing protein n=1 Tax=Pontibacter sp. G13 TaxID=3074898 RepID=UPI002889E0A1|nr:gliding motility-associated C-terminal domain-containing protein [Pontibacter sp. G13]WNJ19572.1 gliding motility-associated C-terminal domain-containing protein [Pontibacter sp. G13]
MHLFTKAMWVLHLPIFLMGYFQMLNATPTSDKVQCVTTISTLVVADTCGKSTGSITLNHDGLAPFTYTWSHDANLNQPVATGLDAGSYSVSVSDGNGCSVSANVIVTYYTPLFLLGSSVPDTCQAGVGIASVLLLDPNAGTAPYSYEWSANAGGQITNTATNLTPGTYVCTVTDAEGCRATFTTSIVSVNNSLEAFVSPAPIPCYGDVTGSAVALPTGGSGEYLYEWTEAGDPTIIGTDSTITNLSAGSYVMTVYDANGPGCFVPQPFELFEPSQIEAEFDLTPATGCKVNDAIINMTPSGGTPGYTYLWQDGSVDALRFNVAPGLYDITITDANGCELDATIVVESNAGPVIDVEVIQADNCGLGEGIARVNIQPGTGLAPYQVVWWTNESQPTDSAIYAYNLYGTQGTSNEYTAIVIDSDSCVVRYDFPVPGADPLEITSLTSEPEYCELANGSAAVTVAGGTQPYTYEWTTSPQGTDSEVYNLIEGTYQVTVRDFFNCTVQEQIFVEKEIPMEVSTIIVDETCFGSKDGTAEAVVTGGYPPYDYFWTTDPPQITDIAIEMSAGEHDLTVTDARGCEVGALAIIDTEGFVEASFTSLPDTNSVLILGNHSVEFINTSIGAYQYEWDFGDSTTSTAIEPVHTYTDSGTYYVELKAYEQTIGCADSITLGPFIVKSQGTVFMPTAFSPNGDNRNDVYLVKGTLFNTYQLRIFNRWGQQVFESVNPEEGWNGQDQKSGGDVPEGVYVYFLEATLADGERTVIKQGNINLIR